MPRPSERRAQMTCIVRTSCAIDMVHGAGEDTQIESALRFPIDVP